MGKRALVILGAGASHDFVPDRPAGEIPQNDPYRPPLTQGIFSHNELTSRLFRDYPGARKLGGSIRVSLSRHEPLEPLLAELAEATDRPRCQLFPQVPLYLRDLFTTISSKLPDQPVNFEYLADRLFASRANFEEVVFVTLNYDTLLDQVLESDYASEPFQGMESYLGERCKLIKLHGSENWVRELIHIGTFANLPSVGRMNQHHYLAALREAETSGLRTMLQGSPEPRIRNTGQLWDVEGTTLRVFYPALSVPLGTYEPACPESHLDGLRRFLPTCRNVLAIGISGADNDLLALLNEGLTDVRTFMLVDHEQPAAQTAYMNFWNGVFKLRSTWPGQPFHEGFSQFLLSGGLESFIEACH